VNYNPYENRGEIVLLTDAKYKILRLLEENSRETTPEVVRSEIIAEKLNLNKTTTQTFIKILHNRGDVLADMDGEFSLLTLQGHNWLQQRSPFSAAPIR
jgi:DNA-binding IclR family transcriptional regulator